MLPHDLRALLVDLDGVMYRGDEALPGAVDLIPTLTRLGIRYAFVTNNATLGAEGYRSKLQGLGVPARTEDIVTSAEATAAYLQQNAEPAAKVCVVGEAGLQNAIESGGFTLDDDTPAFVVVGLDRYLTYSRLVAACRGILNGAAFIGTNPDRALPVKDGLWPGAGSIIAAVSTATDMAPRFIGKPQPTLLHVALERLGIGPDHAAIVGDQVATDIRAGIAAGVGTILIRGDLAQESADAPPDLVVQDLSELLAQLPFH